MEQRRMQDTFQRPPLLPHTMGTRRPRRLRWITRRIPDEPVLRTSRLRTRVPRLREPAPPLMALMPDMPRVRRPRALRAQPQSARTTRRISRAQGQRAFPDMSSTQHQGALSTVRRRTHFETSLPSSWPTPS